MQSLARSFQSTIVVTTTNECSEDLFNHSTPSSYDFQSTIVVTMLGVVVSALSGPTVFPLLPLMLKQAGNSTLGNCISPIQVFSLRIV